MLSGRHLPKMSRGENLLQIVTDLLFRKYDIFINPAEFKVIHRLAGDRILFALHSRLPGFGYDQLINIINSNPKPELQIYASIQLFEPYTDLFYIARRLKYFKVISYYRLDENGNTYIALSEKTKAFKFSNMKQLEQLGVQVPQEIYKELYERKCNNAELENQNAVQTLRKAYEERVMPPAVNQNQQVQPRPQVQYNHRPANAPPSNIPENSGSVIAEQVNQQEVFYDNSAAPSNSFQSFSSNAQQLQQMPVSQQNTQFRFPPPPIMRNPSKRGRSSSNSTPPSSTITAASGLVVTQPKPNFGGFQTPASEQPRQTVKDLVQQYPQVSGGHYGYNVFK